jgi:tRNA (guanine37-N1)-methyltransferase
VIVDILTTFPEMFDAPMSASILGIAQRRGLFTCRPHNLRDWTHDRHRTTDDEPYGGGQGLLMKCEPIFEALDDLQGPAWGSIPGTVIFFSPCGEPFSQRIAEQLSKKRRLIFVCGHYEGIDERVFTRADLCLSLGDYVLTGGELPAMVVCDATVRLIPGVLGDADSPVDESFSDGLLEYPQYTRPASCRGLEVPPVLLSGDHAKVAAWRRRASIERTARLRPDLLVDADLTDDERAFADDVRRQAGQQG